MASSRKELSPDDWSAIATYCKEEKERRAANRKQLEALWKEVDRQVRLEPIPRQQEGRNAKDWYPELEMPGQFNTLEVIAADARRMLFPRETDWYDVNANLSDEYIERFNERRQQYPLIGKEAQPMQIDTETANVLVKTVIDHYHRTYDFLGKMDLCLAEALKYGTFAARVRQVRLTKFSHDFRGVSSQQTEGPALVPTTIKNTYLDDTSAQVMHEGMLTGPLTIYSYWQQLDDLKRAAKAGGRDRGWMVRKIEDLTPKVNPMDDKKGQVELLFCEGDVIVPRSRDSIFLPNVWLTIALGQKEAQVVRFQENPKPFRSYVFGTYMRTDIDSPYGTSPLMKGQPVAEATTEIFCDFTASCRLNALPPVAYDRNDPAFMATGGPDVAPRAMWGTDMPDRILPQKIGDPAALMNAFLTAKKVYEELTGVTDPRRSAEVKSHTTAAAAAYQADVGMTRTEDFISSLESGAITSMLYMEYEIAKQTLGKATPLSVNMDGIEGWIRLGGADLPDDVVFNVTGSSGLADIKTRNEQFVQATAGASQIFQLAAAAGKPFDLDFEGIAKDFYVRAGVQNANKFVRPAQAPDPNAPPPPDPAAMEAQAKMQAEEQKTQAKVKADEEKLQAQMQLDQAKMQQEGQLRAMEMQQEQALALRKLEHERQTQLELAEIETARALQVARIQAGADIEKNVQQLVAEALSVEQNATGVPAKGGKGGGTTVVIGKDGEVMDMQGHGEAMTQAAGKMAESMDRLGEMLERGQMSSSQMLAGLLERGQASSNQLLAELKQVMAQASRPRKRRVTLARGPDGRAVGAEIEE